MTTPAPEVAHLLMALSALLLAAHAVGHAFVLMRQPRVIGELVGGLLLGPTLLGAVAPSLETYLFPATGATAGVPRGAMMSSASWGRMPRFSSKLSRSAVRGKPFTGISR